MVCPTRRAQTANLLGALTVLVQDRVRAAMDSELDRGESAAAALLTIGTRPGQTIDALRRTVGLSHSAAVRLVEGLIRDGWVRKRPGPDRRSTSLLLTASGRRLYVRLLGRRRAIIEQLLGKLSAASYSALEKALAVLLEETAHDRQEAQHICRFCDHRVCRPCPVGSAVNRESRH